MGNIANIHPGEILQEEFLIPMGISAYKLSKSIGVLQTRISLIIKEERASLLPLPFSFQNILVRP